LVDALGPARVAALIDGLPEDARPHRERLVAASACHDLDAMRLAVHALEGIAANLGLVAFAELGGALEQACAEGRTDEAARLCQRLAASWEEGYSRLRELET
jgi:HPt (histidine-containing phosphotransfer) domain-containing protein